MDISKIGKVVGHLQPLPCWTKSLVYFGPQILKLLTLMYLDHNGLFSGDYVSALMGCYPLKFLDAL